MILTMTEYLADKDSPELCDMSGFEEVDAMIHDFTLIAEANNMSLDDVYEMWGDGHFEWSYGN